ncbi:MAG: glycosyltransferase family 25 protein [Holosporaceae bacterium]|jgi:glycosyl transferase family 25|nr:glycosyltransferase family 25 protein [Holosporaceae bacterium]
MKNSRSLNTGKVGAYLINLDRATERLDFVRPFIEALGLLTERISAIDGKTLSQKKIKSITDLESYKKIFKMYPEAGTIGCSLSHEKAWRRFLESDNEFAVIFEDDVQFNPQELLETIELLIIRKTLWDIANFETKHRGCPVKISKLNNHKHLVFYLTNVTHAGCYMVNRNAAHQLLKKFYPIKMPLDHYFTSAWEFNLKFVGIEPRMVLQKFGNSQIKTSSSEKIKTVKIRIISAGYNIQRAIFHFIYNLYCFIRVKANLYWKGDN